MGLIRTFDEIVALLQEEASRARLAVAAAEDPSVLAAVMQAQAEGIAEPILFGDRDQIHRAAAEAGLTLPSASIIHAPDHADAARLAVAAVARGEADMVMKGLLHSDVLLRAILDKECGLRTGGLICHVCIVQADTIGRLLFGADAAMNIAPDLEQKASILRSAVEVARAFGHDCPRVAVLSAVETVKASIPSTVDAACLSKMAQRGQIGCPCIVDGPLALDVAISPEAASHKRVESEVAGRADVMIFPNIETGNVLWKSFVHLSGGKVAGLLAGARAPIVVTSRSDSPEVKFYSIAAAAFVSRRRAP